MRNIIRFITLILLCSAVRSSAQQDPMYSMYMFNLMAVNPAYAGSTDNIVATGLFRRQWLNFPGSPTTATFNLHAPMRNENVGLGMSFINDQFGEIATNGFMGAYAYHLKFKKSRLSLGLQAGVRNFSINLTDVKLSPDQEFDASFASNISQWSVNFGTGLFWYSDKSYFGLSVPHIRNNILSNQEVNPVFIARSRTHGNMIAGHVFKLSPAFRLKPSMLMKFATGAPVQFDINANLYWLEILGIGVSYRSLSSMNFIMEVQINRNLRFGYAFDQTVGRLSGSTGGSHELMLRADFGFNKNKTITPRYF